MNKESISIMSQLDNIAGIHGEMVPGQGEDSFLFRINEKMMISGVFDGCGGLGAKKYPEFENHSGAYLAARIVSGVVMDWFNGLESEEELADGGRGVKSLIQEALRLYSSKVVTKSKFKGSMSKDFPTTAAFSVCASKEESIEIYFFWTGDSRGYLLTSNGLEQMTEDDIYGEDAMSNLKNDGVLTNVISVSADFVLHEKVIQSKLPCIVIHSTDGCFQYLSSPMHFEYLLLKTLQQAESICNWEEILLEEIRKVSGDDHTLTMSIFGYGSFDCLKKSYVERLQYLEESYIRGWEGLSEDTHVALWNKYQGELRKE